MNFPDEYYIIELAGFRTIISVTEYAYFKMQFPDNQFIEATDVFGTLNIISRDRIECIYKSIPTQREAAWEWNELKDKEVEEWRKANCKTFD